MSTEQLLRRVGIAAYASAAALTDKQRVMKLFEAAVPFDGTTRWTEYRGGVFDTRGGTVREASWDDLGKEMLRYTNRVAPKGAGWWFTGAVSKNGRCRDVDIESVTMLILDADGSGEWDTFRRVLEEARVGHIAQRSSSHTPSIPKWHLLIPLAKPWTGTKHEWRCIWRFLVGWLSVAGELRSDVEADPPTYGFDPKTDRLGQPSFPAAKRVAGQAPPETIIAIGNALDLELLMTEIGFDRSWQRVAEVEPPELEGRTCDPSHGLLAIAFAEAGLLRHRIERDGASGFAVVCPTEHQHSGPRRDREDSTVIFDPRPGSTKGYFHCSHRCGSKKPDEILKLLPDDVVERARHRWRASRLTAERTDRARRPKIVISCEEQEINDAAVVALTVHPDVYQRGGALVHVVVDPRTRAPRVTPIALPTLRELLADCVDWRRLEEVETDVFDEVPAHPPDWCVRAVHAREQWVDVRPLAGVVETPTLRRDGSVLQTPGYDEATGLLYLPGGDFPVTPETPSRGDAERAVRDLVEVVRDFPFATDAHLAAWLATVLTLFARPAIDGCVPMAAIDATTRGTGKSKLADVIANIVFGRDASKTPQPKDDDEMRKRITSMLLEGERLIVLDNIARPLGDPSLDVCLTTTTWKDRALGKNSTIVTPNLALWIATGNNLQFIGDTARRCLHIRLESKVERPEDRADFVHPDLLAWVREERSRLVAAALTILRAYFVAGSPNMNAKSWGGFEGWARLVANCVMWAGLKDPQLTRMALEEQSDPVRGALHSLLTAWKTFQDGCSLASDDGLTVGNLLRTLYPPPTRDPRPADPEHYTALRDALESMAPPSAPGKPPSAQQLDIHLRYATQRVVGGMMFDRVKVEHATVKWRVLEVAPKAEGGLGGTGGTNSNPSWERESDLKNGTGTCDAHVRVPEGAGTSPPSPAAPPPGPPANDTGLRDEGGFESAAYDAAEREAIRDERRNPSAA